MHAFSKRTPESEICGRFQRSADSKPSWFPWLEFLWPAAAALSAQGSWRSRVISQLTTLNGAIVILGGCSFSPVGGSNLCAGVCHCCAVSICRAFFPTQCSLFTMVNVSKEEQLKRLSWLLIHRASLFHKNKKKKDRVTKRGIVKHVIPFIHGKSRNAAVMGFWLELKCHHPTCRGTKVGWTGASCKTGGKISVETN